ncbi:conserved Plasmodium protein, unknown function [Plasmodium malariae]|uniref:Uncharacterized protein n=1 Tax=Plasmodium malariae TaxID=5858 RepID=A0A1D3PCC1_PLAMA|nr:conserved Plasmodium protein, unknown function [Plasmodium malariae]SCN12921.1 conserved Plasmodium protein, unknown function [Plasmodium malariae]
MPILDKIYSNCIKDENGNREKTRINCAKKLDSSKERITHITHYSFSNSMCCLSYNNTLTRSGNEEDEIENFEMLENVENVENMEYGEITENEENLEDLERCSDIMGKHNYPVSVIEDSTSYIFEDIKRTKININNNDDAYLHKSLNSFLKRVNYNNIIRLFQKKIFHFKNLSNESLYIQNGECKENTKNCRIANNFKNYKKNDSLKRLSGETLLRSPFHQPQNNNSISNLKIINASYSSFFRRRKIAKKLLLLLNKKKMIDEKVSTKMWSKVIKKNKYTLFRKKRRKKEKIFTNESNERPQRKKEKIHKGKQCLNERNENSTFTKMVKKNDTNEGATRDHANILREHRGNSTILASSVNSANSVNSVNSANSANSVSSANSVDCVHFSNGLTLSKCSTKVSNIIEEEGKQNTPFVNVHRNIIDSYLNNEELTIFSADNFVASDFCVNSFTENTFISNYFSINESIKELISNCNKILNNNVLHNGLDNRTVIDSSMSTQSTTSNSCDSISSREENYFRGRETIYDIIPLSMENGTTEHSNLVQNNSINRIYKLTEKHICDTVNIKDCIQNENHDDESFRMNMNLDMHLNVTTDLRPNVHTNVPEDFSKNVASRFSKNEVPAHKGSLTREESYVYKDQVELVLNNLTSTKFDIFEEQRNVNKYEAHPNSDVSIGEDVREHENINLGKSTQIEKDTVYVPFLLKRSHSGSADRLEGNDSDNRTNRLNKTNTHNEYNEYNEYNKRYRMNRKDGTAEHAIFPSLHFNLSLPYFSSYVCLSNVHQKTTNVQVKKKKKKKGTILHFCYTKNKISIFNKGRKQNRKFKKSTIFKNNNRKNFTIYDKNILKKKKKKNFTNQNNMLKEKKKWLQEYMNSKYHKKNMHNIICTKRKKLNNQLMIIAPCQHDINKNIVENGINNNDDICNLGKRNGSDNVIRANLEDMSNQDKRENSVKATNKRVEAVCCTKKKVCTNNNRRYSTASAYGNGHQDAHPNGITEFSNYSNDYSDKCSSDCTDNCCPSRYIGRFSSKQMDGDIGSRTYKAAKDKSSHPITAHTKSNRSSRNSNSNTVMISKEKDENGDNKKKSNRKYNKLPTAQLDVDPTLHNTSCSQQNVTNKHERSVSSVYIKMEHMLNHLISLKKDNKRNINLTITSKGECKSSVGDYSITCNMESRKGVSTTDGRKKSTQCNKSKMVNKQKNKIPRSEVSQTNNSEYIKKLVVEIKLKKCKENVFVYLYAENEVKICKFAVDLDILEEHSKMFKIMIVNEEEKSGSFKKDDIIKKYCNGLSSRAEKEHIYEMVSSCLNVENFLALFTFVRVKNKMNKFSIEVNDIIVQINNMNIHMNDILVAISNLIPILQLLSNKKNTTIIGIKRKLMNFFLHLTNIYSAIFQLVKSQSSALSFIKYNHQIVKGYIYFVKTFSSYLFEGVIEIQSSYMQIKDINNNIIQDYLNEEQVNFFSNFFTKLISYLNVHFKKLFIFKNILDIYLIELKNFKKYYKEYIYNKFTIFVSSKCPYDLLLFSFLVKCKCLCQLSLRNICSNLNINKFHKYKNVYSLLLNRKLKYNILKKVKIVAQEELYIELKNILFSKELNAIVTNSIHNELIEKDKVKRNAERTLDINIYNNSLPDNTHYAKINKCIELRKNEHPKNEHPKNEHPKNEHPKNEHPKNKHAKNEHAKNEHAKNEHAKNEHPKNEHPKNEHPKNKHPQKEHPQKEHPKSEHPKNEHPKNEHSQKEHPQNEHPKSELPKYEPPKNELQKSKEASKRLKLKFKGKNVLPNHGVSSYVMPTHSISPSFPFINYKNTKNDENTNNILKTSNSLKFVKNIRRFLDISSFFTYDDFSVRKNYSSDKNMRTEKNELSKTSIIAKNQHVKRYYNTEECSFKLTVEKKKERLTKEINRLKKTFKKYEQKMENEQEERKIKCIINRSYHSKKKMNFTSLSDEYTYHNFIGKDKKKRNNYGTNKSTLGGRSNERAELIQIEEKKKKKKNQDVLVNCYEQSGKMQQKMMSESCERKKKKKKIKENIQNIKDIEKKYKELKQNEKKEKFIKKLNEWKLKKMTKRININLLKIRRLKNTKQDSFTSLVKKDINGFATRIKYKINDPEKYIIMDESSNTLNEAINITDEKCKTMNEAYNVFKNECISELTKIANLNKKDANNCEETEKIKYKFSDYSFKLNQIKGESPLHEPKNASYIIKKVIINAKTQIC